MSGGGVRTPNIALVYVGWRHSEIFPLVSGVLTGYVGNHARVVLPYFKIGTHGELNPLSRVIGLLVVDLLSALIESCS